jgi:hypothetical protein
MSSAAEYSGSGDREGSSTFTSRLSSHLKKQIAEDNSVADPDPGFGIRCLFDSWIRDPGFGMGKKSDVQINIYTRASTVQYSIIKGSA